MCVENSCNSCCNCMMKDSEIRSLRTENQILSHDGEMSQQFFECCAPPHQT